MQVVMVGQHTVAVSLPEVSSWLGCPFSDLKSPLLLWRVTGFVAIDLRCAVLKLGGMNKHG